MVVGRAQLKQARRNRECQIMRSSVVAGLLSALLCGSAGGETKQPPRADELAGPWIVVNAEQGLPIRLFFAGNRLTITFTETFQVERKVMIDPTANPARIDVLSEGSEVRAYGIYEVSGEQLRICLADWGCARPEDFTTRQRVCLLTLTRPNKDGRGLGAVLDRQQRLLVDVLLAAGVARDDPALQVALKFVSRSSLPAHLPFPVGKDGSDYRYTYGLLAQVVPSR
jgi:uncharacterized protein (TIGR03067 family)